MKTYDRLREKIGPEIIYIVLFFFTTRIALAVIGALSRLILVPRLNHEAVWVNNIWLDIWGVWDTSWYLGIASHGYSAAVNSLGQANYAFFPLFPLLMKILGGIIGNYYIAGLALSNFFLITACVFLYKLVRLKSDEDTARRAVKFLFLAPVAFILSGVFSESLFLALAIACFYYAKMGVWRRVGILGFFLALTRFVGVLIIFPLVYEYFKSKGGRWEKTKKDIFFLPMIPIGLFVFALYNYYSTGDWLAFFHMQSAWHRYLADPFRVLYGGLRTTDIYALFSDAYSIISILLLSLFYKRIGFSYWLFGIYSIFIPLSAGLTSSMPRYILIIFPFYIIFAKLGKSRSLDQALTIFFALLQGCLMVFWTNAFNLVI